MSWTMAIAIVGAAPIVHASLSFLWEYVIRPRLIPAHRIDAMADLMLAAFGPYAEHEAFLRQRVGWYRDDLLAQGVWLRIRRRLRQRWARGEIALYDSGEVTARPPRQNIPQSGEIA